MGAFRKGIVSLSSQTDAAKRDYLDRRCARGRWSRAEAVSEIFDFWLAMGAPPLSEIDDGHIALPVPKEAAVAYLMQHARSTTTEVYEGIADDLDAFLYFAITPKTVLMSWDEFFATFRPEPPPPIQ